MQPSLEARAPLEKTYIARERAVEGDFPLCDDTWGFDSREPTLWRQALDILEELETKIRGLAQKEHHSAHPWTPQGNKYVVYANGAIKPEGGAFRGIRCDGLDRAAQLAALRVAANETFACILSDKPDVRDHLVWRGTPKAERYLREDGLYVALYVRLGWDAINA